MSKSHRQANELIGRDRELRALVERIEAVNTRGGGAVLLRGAVGIGKSSLLAAARAHAAGKRFQILTTTGIQSESRLPFAGLHQLLRPVLQQIDRLPDSYGNAVRAAFGLIEQVAPSPYLIALSVLELLGDCAESAPVVLLVDDAHWLDRPTAEVLAFISRRLESDPILLIPVITDGFESSFLAARIPELRVERLSDEDAATLLDAHARGLIPPLRNRILKEATGNPLALVELSVALKTTGDAGPVLSSATLPVTDRLRQAFTDRLSDLTPLARCLLHVAAVDDSGVVEHILSAASAIVRREITLDEATEATAAGLVEIDGHQLRFRHPLMRSAIQQAMSPAERHAAHVALAEALSDDPDRRAWHRAAAAVGKNEQIASELEAVAARAVRRGATSVALEAVERAAELAGDPAQRGNRMVRAGCHALVLGRHSEVVRLLNEIDDRDLTPLDRLQVAWLREVCEQRPGSGSPLTTSFVEIADRMRAEGDIQRAFSALLTIAYRCWWSNPDEQTRAHIVAVAERFPVPETDARLIYVLALASPVERGAIVVERVSRLWTELHGNTGPEAQLLGVACMAVGDFVHAEAFMDEAISSCRANGLLGVLVTKLAMQAWTKIPRGDWKEALSMASEGTRIADEIGQTNWITMANLAVATISAYRGDITAAEALVSASDEVLLPLGAVSMMGLLQYSRGVAALADGRHDEAYQHLRRIFDPSDNAHHPHIRSWALVDMVEAAVHSGHDDEASAFVRELESVATQTRSPLLQAGLKCARPMLSPDNSEEGFQASLGADLANWPFVRARLQLAYGIWLRRDRRVADSRIPLRAARDTFAALGAVSWGDRAHQELRASGETSRRRTLDLSDALSPQELQIAKLAAAGMSNKEIGQQLFLSHRTISSHLYRIFPKLGITARSHLRATLEDRSTEETN